MDRRSSCGSEGSRDFERRGMALTIALKKAAKRKGLFGMRGGSVMDGCGVSMIAAASHCQIMPQKGR